MGHHCPGHREAAPTLLQPSQDPLREGGPGPLRATLLRCRHRAALHAPPPRPLTILMGAWLRSGLRHRGVATSISRKSLSGTGLDDRLVSLQEATCSPLRMRLHTRQHSRWTAGADDRGLMCSCSYHDVASPDILGMSSAVTETPGQCGYSGASRTATRSHFPAPGAGGTVAEDVELGHRYEAVCSASPQRPCPDSPGGWEPHPGSATLAVIQAQGRQGGHGKGQEERIWTSLWLTQSHSST